ncbi:MAG: hypothetical protein EHM40_13465 [Chloroflexi bacterium]|nr:MAG: hypothetical protein EHM40_13465 [Chloroflexota bacterium]
MSVEDDVIGLSKENYGEKHTDHIFEIYKLYVEMADKISERRQSANSFFLSLNSAIVALVGYVNVSQDPASSSVLPFFSLVAISGMILCYLWYRLVRSYKDINTGKFKVVHAIEKLLPLHPYAGEWTALGKGQDPKLYLPFTHIETYVPWVFFGIHLFVFVGSFIQ